MPEWEVNISLWFSGNQEELVDMCRAMTKTLVETMELEQKFNGTEGKAGLNTVTYKPAFLPPKEPVPDEFTEL